MISTPTDLANMNLWLRGGVGEFDAVSGGSATVSGAIIKRWEDQTGLGNHVTQATVGTCPKNDGSGGVAFEVSADQRMALPAGYSVNARSFTIAFVMEETGTRDGYIPVSPFFTDPRTHFASPSDICNLYTNRDGLLKVIASGSVIPSTIRPPTSRSLVVMTCAVGACTLYVNGVSSVLTALTAATATGGYVGGYQGGATPFPGQGIYYDVMGWNRALTGTEVSDLLVWSQANRGVQTSHTYNLVIDGDSITSGVGTTLCQTWVRQMGLPSAFKITNRAEASAAISTSSGAAILSTEAATFIDTYIESGKINVLVLFAGTNDMFAGATNATLYTNTKAYLAARKAAGWNKIILIGTLPRGGTPAPPANFETYRQALRASFLADFSIATAYPLIFAASGSVTYGTDLYIDMGGDATIGQAGQNTNETNYADGIHLTNIGNGRVASQVKNAIGLVAGTITASNPIERGATGQTVSLVANGLSLTNTLSDYTLSSGSLISITNGSPNDDQHKIATIDAPTSSGTIFLTFIPSGIFGSITVSDTIAPSSPVSLVSTVTINPHISWSNVPPTGDGPYTFDVQRSIDGGATWTTISAAQSQTTYVDSNLSSNTPYTYQVRSHDAAGNASLYSSPLVVRSGGGALVMTPIASATVSVPNGSNWTNIQDISTGANAVSELMLDVSAPAGANVSLRAMIRAGASGRLIPVKGDGESIFRTGIYEGNYPISGGGSSSFYITIPKACDSVVIQAKHDSATSKSITSLGSLA